MEMALLATTIWFIIWWLYAIYDVFFSRSHEIIPEELWGIRLNPLTQHSIKVLIFPLYMLYQCIIILFKCIHYLCYQIFFEMILMGLLRLIGLVIKGIFIFLTRIFD